MLRPEPLASTTPKPSSLRVPNLNPQPSSLQAYDVTDHPDLASCKPKAMTERGRRRKHALTLKQKKPAAGPGADTSQTLSMPGGVLPGGVLPGARWDAGGPSHCSTHMPQCPCLPHPRL